MIIRMNYEDMYRSQDAVVGSIVKVMEYEHDVRDEPKRYKLSTDIETGWPGNLDSSERCYHGWRGTTNNVRATALGVREIINIKEQKNGLYRIKLSDDLHPDWE